MLPKIMSLISIVLLMLWMFYFVCGSLPLLTLKHDDPRDSRFVRGFFDVHYLGLMGIAAIGALSSAIADHRLLAAAIGCIALIGFTARRVIVSRMDRVRSNMSTIDALAIRRFRRLHVAGVVLNFFLLGGFLTVLIVSSAEFL